MGKSTAVGLNRGGHWVKVGPLESDALQLGLHEAGKVCDWHLSLE